MELTSAFDGTPWNNDQEIYDYASHKKYQLGHAWEEVHGFLVEEGLDKDYAEAIIENLKELENTTTGIDAYDENVPSDESVGGWLAVFLYLGVGLGTLITLFSTFAVLSEPLLPSDFKLFGYGYILCFLVLAIMTLVQFHRKAKDAVAFGKGFTLLVLIDGIGCLFIGEYSGIRSIIWSIIWFSFLCVSVKVERMIPPGYRKASITSYIITGGAIIFLCLFIYKIHSLISLYSSLL